MKCAACGYEYVKRHMEIVDVLYKIGPKKGQVRTQDYQMVEEVGGKPFEQIGFLFHVGFLFHEANDNNWTTVTILYACPKCGTVRKDVSYG